MIARRSDLEKSARRVAEIERLLVALLTIVLIVPDQRTRTLGFQ